MVKNSFLFVFSYIEWGWNDTPAQPCECLTWLLTPSNTEPRCFFFVWTAAFDSSLEKTALKLSSAALVVFLVVFHLFGGGQVGLWGGIGMLNELWEVCWGVFFLLFLFWVWGSSVRRELLCWAFEAAVWSHFPGVQAGERCGLGSASEPEQVCLGKDEGYKP